MNRVDTTQRNTGARWWLGPLAVFVVSFILPFGGLIVGAMLTGYLAIRKAPRRDVVAMAVATVAILVLVILATTGVLDAYNDQSRLFD